MKYQRYLFVTLMAGAGFCTGCQTDNVESEPPSGRAPEEELPSMSPPDQEPDSEPDTNNTADRRTFYGTGVVKNITPSRTYIVIKHQAISGYMGAMTMPFVIKDENVLKSVVVGDSIDFELSLSGSETFVSSITSLQK